jgi:hypothetical protein
MSWPGRQSTSIVGAASPVCTLESPAADGIAASIDRTADASSAAARVADPSVAGAASLAASGAPASLLAAASAPVLAAVLAMLTHTPWVQR